ncbi:uncharacterized protein I303_104743 [Kwoniella dejecticola CBS 10117]|uniref:SUN domain-containing protein n=1 Tax=Kwoniella dejecticola CBS 10117 TaxID=1296121 RepID=A0A1A6A4G7_9TREE|nr:uncharacterized protein I303_04277 [Kwoniella dejecticola CBS 10117]OBR84952.1 hypothetical protein I303_04277 [Kwoniella dejecticola CBS 10117]
MTLRHPLGLLLLCALLSVVRGHNDLTDSSRTADGQSTQNLSSNASSTDTLNRGRPSSAIANSSPFDMWSSFRVSEYTCSLLDGSDLDAAPATKEPPEELAYSSTASIAQPTESPEPFISFEDWKKIKQAEEEEQDTQDEAEAASSSSVSEQSEISSGNNAPIPTETAVNQSHANDSSNVTVSPGQSSAQTKGKSDIPTSNSASVQRPSASPPPAPHHNRYNYASPDCSARIHSSSPQTQHASSLLHKSRDRYMLTPCKAKEHWAVIELCDEIRIEAVEIAIWEFFSGVVREVRVSVGGEDDEDFEDDPADDVTGRSVKWEEVGSFVGKNVRGVQTFTLSQPTSFHRFVRLDFPSYYGTEYYCPVSQLKVYGMNQMEAFKWEQKRISAASKGRNEAKEKEAEERRAKDRAEKEKQANEEKDRQQEREKELDALEKLLHEQAGRVVPDILTETAILSKLAETANTRSSDAKSSSTTATSSSVDTALTTDSSQTPNVNSDNGNGTSDPPKTAQNMNTMTTDTAAPSSPSVSASTSSSSTYSRSSPPRTDSSESIYAFIIRRLNDLEGNSTLVARYIEEQAKVMRLMLTRVEKGWDEWKEDDRGKWEQERMRQEDRLGKVISQLELQRSAFEEERKTFQTQLRGLTDELGYERRRGLAQLFVMFIIIILGVISRSSTIDAVLKPLLAEAKRRRSIYGSKSFSGPLTGLRIDMGAGRPPAVIGQGRPKSLSDLNDALIPQVDSPTSPTPTPVSAKSHARSLGKSNSIKRSGTPRQRKLPPGVLTNFRSVSATDHLPGQVPLNTSSSSPLYTSSSGLTSPRPRGSLSSSLNKPNGPTKKLARSSHLHIIDSDRRKSKSPRPIHTSTLTSPVNGDERTIAGDGFETPRKATTNHHQVFQNGDRFLSTSPSNEVSPFTISSSQMPEQSTVDDGPSDWGTDAETEASVSEVEDEVEHLSNNIVSNNSSPGTDDHQVQVADEVVKELANIWNNPSSSSGK